MCEALLHSPPGTGKQLLQTCSGDKAPISGPFLKHKDTRSKTASLLHQERQEPEPFPDSWNLFRRTGRVFNPMFSLEHLSPYFFLCLFPLWRCLCSFLSMYFSLTPPSHLCFNKNSFASQKTNKKKTPQKTGRAREHEHGYFPTWKMFFHQLAVWGASRGTFQMWVLSWGGPEVEGSSLGDRHRKFKHTGRLPFALRYKAFSPVHGENAEMVTGNRLGDKMSHGWTFRLPPAGEGLRRDCTGRTLSFRPGLPLVYRHLSDLPPPSAVFAPTPLLTDAVTCFYYTEEWESAQSRPPGPPSLSYLTKEVLMLESLADGTQDYNTQCGLSLGWSMT